MAITLIRYNKRANKQGCKKSMSLKLQKYCFILTLYHLQYVIVTQITKNEGILSLSL